MLRSLNFRNSLFSIVAVLAALIYFNGMKTGGFQHQYQIQEIEPVDAKKLIDAGGLIIDVRGREQFKYRHIPGAILITLAELNSAIPAQLVTAKDRAILVYCGDGVDHGPEGTNILNKAGYTKAVNLKGGIEGW